MDLTLYHKNFIIFGSMFFIILYSVYLIYIKGSPSIIWDIGVTGLSFFLIVSLGIIVPNLSLDF